MPTLFDPITVGDLRLPNRIFMAPLTRSRAVNPGRVPTPLMADYYRQRATAGLILSEAASVTPMGIGYANTPGIWSNEQVEGWRRITAAVHEQGGHIFLQLWHVGRVSDPIFLNGQTPVSASAVRPKGHVSIVRPQKEFVTPRPLALSEIPDVLNAYAQGAENAKRAGFDGVELHGANGYLLDQFLQTSTNHRTDRYGGSVENRARLMLEATDAVLSIFPAIRVGMHLAPRADIHDMGDANPLETFSYVARELGKRKLAFIAAREHTGANRIGPQLKQAFQAAGGGAYVANEKFTKETAAEALSKNEADAVAFGVPFIANPDLVARFQQNAPLNPPNPGTFYQFTKPEEGYVDYPTLSQSREPALA